MNTNLRKLSLAVALVLGVALTGAAHAASHSAPAHTAGQGKVIYLGTIKVTRADAEGAKRVARYGSTAYLGRIQVTPADSQQAYDAARYAMRTGAIYLGAVEVTADDSEDARYAARLAAEAPGTAYLGSIQVKPSKADAALLASNHMSRTSSVMRKLRALVFGLVGG